MNSPKPVASSKGGFLDWISNYESLVVFGGFGALIVGVVILSGIFQAGPEYRYNVLYNAFGAMIMAVAFIYTIFNFMGSKLLIFGKSVDVGMIIYVSIVLFIMFVFGN